VAFACAGGPEMEDPAAGGPGPDGVLDPKLVVATIRSHLGEVKTCYEQLLARHPGAGGRVHARFSIDEQGAVVGTRITSGFASGGESLERCMIEVISQIHFPPPQGGRVDVEFPFVMQSDPAR
jgi:TonB family protein